MVLCKLFVPDTKRLRASALSPERRPRYLCTEEHTEGLRRVRVKLGHPCRSE